MEKENDKIKKGAGMLEQIGNSNRKTWDEIRTEFGKMTPEKVQEVIDECARRSRQEYPLTFDESIPTIKVGDTIELIYGGTAKVASIIPDIRGYDNNVIRDDEGMFIRFGDIVKVIHKD